MALAIAGCGDEDKAAPPPATQPAPAAAVKVAELEGRITEYCEKRSSGSASAADEGQAADDLRELIDLPRSMLRANALREVAIVLRADCSGSPLGRRARRAVAALQP